MRESALIIGDGRMGRIHADAYKDCDIGYAVAGKDTWLDCLHDMDPDYVSVCSYDDAHFEQAMAAINAGASVIVEKPLCMTEDQLKQIVNTGANVYCNLPLSNIVLPFGAYYYRADYIWGRADRLTGWRAKVPGYSFTLGAGIHMVDCILRNAIPRKITHVRAEGTNPADEFPSPTFIQATCRFEDGAIFGLTIDASTVGVHEHRFQASTHEGTVEIRRWGSDKKRGIVRFIEEGFGNLSETADAMAVCFAIDRSIKSGKTETVEYP